MLIGLYIYLTVGIIFGEAMIAHSKKTGLPLCGRHYMIGVLAWPVCVYFGFKEAFK